MIKWIPFVIAIYFVVCLAREPFKHSVGSTPYLVYYPSRYRGICGGTLVSRMMVLSAAVCVVNPHSNEPDLRPINVITGTNYRQPRRGIRVQVEKMLLPKFPSDLGERAFEIQTAPVLFVLKKKVPDILAEAPLRAIDIDWRGEEVLTLQEECIISGWHFFYKEDTVYHLHKFLLQRHARTQFVNLAKFQLWCDTLSLKFMKAMQHVGYKGVINQSSEICIKDPDGTAQACHGMYGSALICKGKVVGLMSAPDAQWTNCTGLTNIIHLLSNPVYQSFFKCVQSLLEPDESMNWQVMKHGLTKSSSMYDYIPAMYGKLVERSGSSSDSAEDKLPT